MDTLDEDAQVTTIVLQKRAFGGTTHRLCDNDQCNFFILIGHS